MSKSERTRLTVDDANRIIAERTAPWVQDLRIRVEALRDDGLTVRLPFAERITHSSGTIAGQALLALADSALFIAAVNALDGGFPAATANQSMNFMRRAHSKDLIAEVRILKHGRSLMFGDVMVYMDGDPDPVAHATLTYALRPAKE